MIFLSNDVFQDFLALPQTAPTQQMLAASKAVEKLCIDVMVSRNDTDSPSSSSAEPTFEPASGQLPQAPQVPQSMDDFQLPPELAKMFNENKPKF